MSTMAYAFVHYNKSGDLHRDSLLACLLHVQKRGAPTRAIPITVPIPSQKEKVILQSRRETTEPEPKPDLPAQEGHGEENNVIDDEDSSSDSGSGRSSSSCSESDEENEDRRRRKEALDSPSNATERSRRPDGSSTSVRVDVCSQRRICAYRIHGC